MTISLPRLREFAEWFQSNRPEPPPPDTPQANLVTSFQMVAFGETVILRVAMNPDHVADFHLNPYVARQLLEALLTAGQEVGWLDARGQFIVSDGDDE